MIQHSPEDFHKQSAPQTQPFFGQEHQFSIVLDFFLCFLACKLVYLSMYTCLLDAYDSICMYLVGHAVRVKGGAWDVEKDTILFCMHYFSV